MKNITIPVELPHDLLIALNQSEKELKLQFQTVLALWLFQQGKLTLGKAIQLSGLTRYEFERALAQSRIPVAELDVEQIFSDADKIAGA